MVQSMIVRCTLWCVIQVPKGMFAAMQVQKPILLYICIDVLSISVKLMDSEEIHTIFDNAMREFANDPDRWDGPMYSNVFVVRLWLTTRFQLFGLMTTQELEEFLTTNYSTLFKIKHTNDSSIVLSKPIEKQNTKYANCYLMIKLKSFSVFRANQWSKIISKNSKCIIGTNKHKIFDVDTNRQSVMIAAFVDKLKPTLDTMIRKMNENVFSRFQNIQIQCVSIDDGVLADIKIKYEKHTWPTKFYTEVVNKTFLTKEKVFQDIEKDIQSEYQKNINEGASLLLGYYVPAQIVGVIVTCLDCEELFGNMNDKEKYNIINKLLQKKSPSEWLSKKSNLLIWGLSCAQNPDYLPSNFQDLYN